MFVLFLLYRSQNVHYDRNSTEVLYTVLALCSPGRFRAVEERLVHAVQAMSQLERPPSHSLLHGKARHELRTLSPRGRFLMFSLFRTVSSQIEARPLQWWKIVVYFGLSSYRGGVCYVVSVLVLVGVA